MLLPAKMNHPQREDKPDCKEPLGEQLMGKKSGQEPQLNFGGAKQAAKILKVE